MAKFDIDTPGAIPFPADNIADARALARRQFHFGPGRAVMQSRPALVIDCCGKFGPDRRHPGPVGVVLQVNNLDHVVGGTRLDSLHQKIR